MIDIKVDPGGAHVLSGSKNPEAGTVTVTIENRHSEEEFVIEVDSKEFAQWTRMLS